jgi:hypothetical protein
MTKIGFSKTKEFKNVMSKILKNVTSKILCSQNGQNDSRRYVTLNDEIQQN